ncbi:hypothetical protein IWW38_001717 [Coemansia aciculifera]|uniref:Uncharacterized protein n=1 Tax=Coemansia aciculifera TaxID=417176 RepID=A0ACC1M682_9FUNG|nr:hypothetical protein IWW38_001717 [Coemansia aciculifera]
MPGTNNSADEEKQRIEGELNDIRELIHDHDFLDDGEYIAHIYIDIDDRMSDYPFTKGAKIPEMREYLSQRDEGEEMARDFKLTYIRVDNQQVYKPTDEDLILDRTQAIYMATYKKTPSILQE